MWSILEHFWCIWVKIRYILSIKSMNFMQFCNEKWNYSTLNLWSDYFVRSKNVSKGYHYVPRDEPYKIEKKNTDISWFWKWVFTYLIPTVNSAQNWMVLLALTNILNVFKPLLIFFAFIYVLGEILISVAPSYELFLCYEKNVTQDLFFAK